MIKSIDPMHFIKHRLCRDNCVKRNFHMIKDLRVINRDVKHCIAVDNSAICFMTQLDNLYPIPSYNGDCHDFELKKLMEFLTSIGNKDIRKMLDAKFSMKSKILNKKGIKL